MNQFEIKDDFYLNGEKIQIISGGMHYFRILPEYWEDRLLKLKALGCNTVETYIPWNLHEKEKGQFDFFGKTGYCKIRTDSTEAGTVGDLTPYSLYLRRVGVWRSALLAFEGRRHEASLYV